MKTLLAIAFFVSTLCAGAGRAWAGYCDEQGAAAMIGELEKLAKKPKAVPQIDEICMDAAGVVPRLVKRALAACQVILERDAAYAPCIEWSIRYGAKTLGAIDLLDRALAVFPPEPFSYGHPAMELFLALGDVRALPIVTEAWKSAQADKRAAQKKYAFSWRVWRSAAARFLGAHGGAAQRDFLTEQLASPQNKDVAKALKKAISAIDRAAK